MGHTGRSAYESVHPAAPCGQRGPSPPSSPNRESHITAIIENKLQSHTMANITEIDIAAAIADATEIAETTAQNDTEVAIRAKDVAAAAADVDDVVTVTGATVPNTIDAFDQECLHVSQEIRTLYNRFRTETFHGLGTLQDYHPILEKLDDLKTFGSTLAAAKLGDMDKFSAQAKEIGDVLSSISTSLHTTSTINDIEVLKSVRKFLTDLHHLQDAVKKFHIEVDAMMTVSFPRTLKDTAQVMTEAARHMDTVRACMSYFVGDPTIEAPLGAAISAARTADIADAASRLHGLKNATNDSIVSANEDVAAITEAAARIGSTDLSDVVLRLKAFKESFAAAGKHKQENKMSP